MQDPADKFLARERCRRGDAGYYWRTTPDEIARRYVDFYEPPPKRRVGKKLMGLAVFVFIVSIMWATSLLAHDWYDAACCNDNDCAPIDAKYVTATEEGYLVTLPPGSHFMVTEERGTVMQLFKYGDRSLRRSQDDQFHACVGYSRMFCLYEPRGMF